MLHLCSNQGPGRGLCARERWKDLIRGLTATLKVSTAGSHGAAAERKLWGMLHFPFQPNQGSAGTSIDRRAPNSRRDDSDWSDGGSLGVPEFSSTESGAAEVLLFATILGWSTVLAAKAAPDGSFYRTNQLISFNFAL